MSETARVQYVFLDVVGFTKDRSVEAQSDVVAALNTVVNNSLATMKVLPEKTILLPTGDGIATALIDVPGVDTHLLLALHVLRMVAEHNSTISDPSRRFEIRVGINENIDNLVQDVNGRRNVAGAGISMAQRIMDKADGGQILVGSTVFDILRQRERYMSSFRAFTAHGKHGITFLVYQFISRELGLNISIPSVFVVKKREPKKLTKYSAYYFGHAIANRDFLLSRKKDPMRDYTASILLAFLAEDSVKASDTPAHDEAMMHTWESGLSTFEEQYQHYNGLEFWVSCQLSRFLQAGEIASHAEHFEGDLWEKSTWLVMASGLQKLISEWPQVASEFGITLESAG
jgi:class 3 adenylate cyclase